MKKIIAWENWSEIEKELSDDTILVDEQSQMSDDEESLLKEIQNEFIFHPMTAEMKSPIIQTPFGPVHIESKLKPSDRWDCWLGYTNFNLTEEIEEKIKNVEGIDALKIMSRYTFCIGVAKLFQFSEVRRNIENELCGTQGKVRKSK